METDKLTRSAITAQLTIAHLQKVAYFVDFQKASRKAYYGGVS